MTRSRATWLLLISAGCIYGSPSARSLAADDECRRVCADVHEGCVRGGLAGQLGLPGVTYDLCAHEQETCLTGCRSGGGRVAGAGSDGGVVPPGVVWEATSAKLRCPLSTSWLEVPEAWRKSVQVVSPGEVRLQADSAMAAMEAGSGAPPSVFVSWFSLHRQLAALTDSPTLKMTTGAQSPSAWSFEYAITDGGTTGAFRMRQKTVRRAGAYCRVIAVERAEAPQRTTSLLDGFH